jgi:hypothetical protein
MSRLDPNDQVPGPPADSRRMSSGTVLLIMPITNVDGTSVSRLVLRCEPDGRMFAAISDPPRPSDTPEA